MLLFLVKSNSYGRCYYCNGVQGIVAVIAVVLSPFGHTFGVSLRRGVHPMQFHPLNAKTKSDMQKGDMIWLIIGRWSKVKHKYVDVATGLCATFGQQKRLNWLELAIQMAHLNGAFERGAECDCYVDCIQNMLKNLCRLMRWETEAIVVKCMCSVLQSGCSHGVQ